MPVHYVVFLLWLTGKWIFLSPVWTPNIAQLLSCFSFASWFSLHTLTGQYTAKNSKGLSLALQSSLFVYFPHFWYSDPQILSEILSPSPYVIGTVAICLGFSFPPLQSGNCLQAVTGVIIRRAHVMCFPSLRDYSSALPSVQSLQTVISHILFVF